MSVLFRALRVQGPELTDLLFYAGGALNAVSVKMGGSGLWGGVCLVLFGGFIGCFVCKLVPFNWDARNMLGYSCRVV